MTNGWKIKVTVQGQPARLYAAAESDPRLALILAQKALGASPPRDRLETAGEISAQALEKFGIKGGEIKDVTESSAHL